MVQFAANPTSTAVGMEETPLHVSVWNGAGSGKSLAAKAASKSALPSFAAQLIGQPPISDGIGKDRTASFVEKTEDTGKLTTKNPSVVAADNRIALGSGKLNERILSDQKPQEKKEARKTSHKSTTPYSDTKRKQKDYTSSSATSPEYAFVVHVAIPAATEPLREPGKKMFARSSGADAMHVDASTSTSTSAQTASLHSDSGASTKIQPAPASISDSKAQEIQPPEVHDLLAADHPSLQASAQNISPEPQQPARSEPVQQKTPMESAPVISASMPKREIRELPEPKIGNRQKVTKDVAESGVMQSHEVSSGKGAISDLPRTSGGPLAIQEFVRPAENENASLKRLSISPQGNTFQQLDAGSASPMLLHSNAHSLAVGVHDPVLGWVEVQTQTAAGHLNATLTTASMEAHASLAADGPSIAQYLAEKNVSVHSVSVHTQSGSMGGGQSQANSGNSHQQPSASHDRLLSDTSNCLTRGASVDAPEVPVMSENARISVRA
ncbi:MAG TPA: hypothetical protein VFE38_00995 [Edaphobacter sp.]|nr:hypothetical protein [Edaphobacter sp.]